VAWSAELSAQPAASASVSTRALTLSAFIFIIEKSFRVEKTAGALFNN
jgi:hypothetical protein